MTPEGCHVRPDVLRILKPAGRLGDRSVPGPVLERGTRRGAVPGLALLSYLALAGCWLPQQLVSGCPELAGPPPILSFELYGSERHIKGWRDSVRDTMYITLYETRSVRLGFNNPYYEWCEPVSEADFPAWLENAAVLSREPRVRGLAGPTEELVAAGTPRRGDEQRGVVVVDQITPAGLDAVQELLCLARKAFGSRVTNATLEITPELAARVGFPDTCPASMAAAPG